MYKTTERINDTIPIFKIDNLKERYNESLLKKTELTKKKNCYEKIKYHLDQIEVTLSITTYTY